MIGHVGFPPPDLFQWARAYAPLRRDRRRVAPPHEDPVDVVMLSRAARRILDQERRLADLRRADSGKGRRP